MIPTLTIPQRLGILVAVAVLITGAAFVVQLVALRGTLNNERSVALRNEVATAISIVTYYDKQAVDGQISGAEAQQRAKSALRAVRFGENDYFFVYDSDGVNLVLGPRPDLEGKSLVHLKDADGVFYVSDLLRAAKNGGGFVSYNFPRAGSQVASRKLGYAVTFAPWNWMIGSGVYIDDVDTIFKAKAKEAASWYGGLFLILAFSAWLISRGIVRSVTALTETLKRLAAGDVNVSVPANRRDELGSIARVIHTLKENIAQSEDLRRQNDSIQHELELKKAQFVADLLSEFESEVQGSLDALSAGASKMHATAIEMLGTTVETSNRSKDVAAAAQQTSENVTRVAASIGELTTSVSEISQQVEDSTAIVGSAVEEARRTNLTVVGLSEAAQKIGEVVSLISAIANQTNLLSLNATIEAARAGDAGKGFAIVANEVKQLANQTAGATQEIDLQVSSMQQATGTAVTAIHLIRDTIGKINAIASAIASAVRQQEGVADAISRNVRDAAVGADLVSTTMTVVNRSAGQAGDAAVLVRDSAEDVGILAAALRSNLDNFLTKLRTA